MKFFVMDTIVEIQAKGEKKKADKAIRSAIKEIERIDKHLGYNHSTVSDLNNKHQINDPELYRLVDLSLEIEESSHGSFCLSLRPILDAWGFTGSHPQIPAPEIVEAWKNSRVDHPIDLGNADDSIRIKGGGSIDLGGIAKGYATDMAAEAMMGQGIRTGLVNAGGDIRVFGTKTWHIGIKHPRAEGTLTTVDLKNRAIATSGDYERYFIDHGRRYCHILDPDTGYPANRYMSVTVIADRCVLADAWATAIFAGGIEGMKTLLDKRGMEWVIIDHDGRIRSSQKLAQYLPDHI